MIRDVKTTKKNNKIYGGKLVINFLLPSTKSLIYSKLNNQERS